MSRMLKVVGIGLAMGLVIASLGEASAKQPPSAKHFGSVSVQPSAKVKGYTIVNSGSLNAPAGGQTHGTVACPTGTKPLGGGVGVASSDLAVNINSTYPNGTAGWAVDVNNGSSSATGFAVYAVCAKKPAGYSVVTAQVTNPAASQTTATATCPSGAKVLGGGGYSSSLSISVNLNTTIPGSPTSWRADQNNATGNTVTVKAYAICGKNVTGWKLVTGASTTNPASSETLSTVGCPGGRSVLGGGAYSDSSNTAINVNTTYPQSSTTWASYENNASSSVATTKSVAICAKV
jgi:hypothetical protein